MFRLGQLKKRYWLLGFVLCTTLIAVWPPSAAIMAVIGAVAVFFMPEELDEEQEAAVTGIYARPSAVKERPDTTPAPRPSRPTGAAVPVNPLPKFSRLDQDTLEKIELIRLPSLATLKRPPATVRQTVVVIPREVIPPQPTEQEAWAVTATPRRVRDLSVTTAAIAEHCLALDEIGSQMSAVCRELHQLRKQPYLVWLEYKGEPTEHVISVRLPADAREDLMGLARQTLAELESWEDVPPVYSPPVAPHFSRIQPPERSSSFAPPPKRAIQVVSLQQGLSATRNSASS